MDSRQIHKILKSDKQVTNANFLGVFPIDLIPMSSLNFPCSLVINTKPHDHPGEHWVAVIKTEDRHGIYFDSYGNSPYNLPEIVDVLENCDEWTFNDTALQSPFSTVCGQYTIFAITHLVRGYSLSHVVHLLKDVDRYTNDAFIYNYIKQKYREIDENLNSLEVIDFPFVFNQISNAIESN